MNIAKDLLKKAVVLLIFGAIIAGVVLYQAGFYDISFIKRPIRATENEETDPPSVSTAENTETEDTETNPPDTEKTDYNSDREFIEKIEAGDASKIYAGEYGKNNSINRLGFVPSFSEIFSLRTKTESYTEAYSRTNTYLDFRTVERTIDIPIVGLYFGFVIIDGGQGFTVLTPDGQTVCENFDGSFPFMRTKDGTPLVEKGGKYYLLEKGGISKNAVGNGDIDPLPLYYDFPEYDSAPDLGYTVYSDWYIRFDEITTKPANTSEPETTEPESSESESQTSLPESSEPESGDPVSSEITEPPVSKSESEPIQSGELSETVTVKENNPDEGDAAEPDVPESEPFPTEVSDGETVTVNGRKYKVFKRMAKGYLDSKGNVAVEAKYEEVFPFSSNGICTVRDFNGELMFVNKKGKVIVNRVAEGAIRPEDVYVYCLQRHFEPLNPDEYSVGSFLFRNGYCMVRYALTRKENDNTVLRTYNMLVNEKGKYLTLPDGYSLISYSDGVLLLEKNGLYGYMRSDGSWIESAVFEEAHPFFEGLATVCRDGKYGLIDKEGHTVLPIWFDWLSTPSRGVISAYSSERGWELYCVN